LHPSGRFDIPSGRSTVQASSVRTTRTFCPDHPLCPEPSNCSRLHLSRSLRNSAGCLSLFDKEKDFVPKHRYGKTATTVRMMCVPVLTLSLIRQVVHTKFNHPNVRLHGPNAQALYMEIACISSTIRTSYFMVRMLKALIWKLRTAKFQSSGR
jgi:hypothetical protein